MEMLYVQFSDTTETAIVAYFASPQNPSVYSNLGEISGSDSRYATFYDDLPAIIQATVLAPSQASG